MTRIVDVHLQNDGSAVVDGDKVYPAGPATKDALRNALADIADQARSGDSDSVVRVHRLDGEVSTINALRDGSIRKPQPNDPTTDLRTPVRPASEAWWRSQSRSKIIAAAAIAVVVLGGTAIALTQTGTDAPAAEATAAAPDISRPRPPAGCSRLPGTLRHLAIPAP
ncbi:hypothetical protein GTA09_20915 [Rhodococcus hoagii]|nr:hypothetical protein [Prescottella equi]